MIQSHYIHGHLQVAAALTSFGDPLISIEGSPLPINGEDPYEC